MSLRITSCFYAAIISGFLNGCTIGGEQKLTNIDRAKVALEKGDCALAFELLKTLKSNGNLEERYLLGQVLMCLAANDTEEDVAFQLIKSIRDESRKEAKKNNIDAQYRLAHMYTNTSQLLLDKDEAIYWANMAAKQGHIAAAYELSQLLVGKDSFAWLSYSADHGYGEAQWELANLYALGSAEYGVGKNKKKAFEYYKLAAENGFEMAFYDYAIDLINGDGGYKNLQEGKKWMLKAAKSGNIAAIKFFVNAYTIGCYGLNADSYQAKYWKQRLDLQAGKEAGKTESGVKSR